MRHRATSGRIHDVYVRESRDKVVLALAFVAGVGGGIALKVMGVHPFIAAGFSAFVLILYAILAYASTSLRLEPEVIGDNSYYLGFLFTLTSLSVTLYFVVESGADDRAKLIPEVISGFGVALVSTIVGVFVRVLMMQFRLDVVSRERETRVEIDQSARQLRSELALSLQQMKAFSVESLQHSAEREAEFKRATDMLVSSTHKSINDTARFLHEESSKVFREQSAAAVDSIRSTIANASEAALGQIKVSLEDIGKSAEYLRANHALTRSAVEQAHATLVQQTSTMAGLVGELALRIKTVSYEVEKAGTILGGSFTHAAERLETALADTSLRLGTSLQGFEQVNRSAAARTQVALNDLETKLAASADRLSAAAKSALILTDSALVSPSRIDNES